MKTNLAQKSLLAQIPFVSTYLQLIAAQTLPTVTQQKDRYSRSN